MKFEDIDFAGMFREIQRERKKEDRKAKQERWDKRAPSFLSPKKSSYTKTFLDKMTLFKDDEVIDFGCGPGTIALEVAPVVKSVLGCDISRGMLDQLENNARNLGLTNIEAKQKAFEDSFDDLPECDVFIASRSLDVADIEDILKKIIYKTKRSVYLTYKVGKYFFGKEISEVLGVAPAPDYILVLNILYNLGVNAKLDFIRYEDTRLDSTSFDEFIQKVSWYCGEPSSEQKRELEKIYNKREHKDTMGWAFISFDV